MTLTRELREAARTCSNEAYAESLRNVADCLFQAIREFAAEPTRDNAKLLNCAWAIAERVLKNVPAEGDPAPLSGPSEPARLAA